LICPALERRFYRAALCQRQAQRPAFGPLGEGFAQVLTLPLGFTCIVLPDDLAHPSIKAAMVRKTERKM
jgi:hypothetical protein